MTDAASSGIGKTEVERLAHYRELAARFRLLAESETVPETRDGLFDIFRQYARLARELEARLSQRPDE
jgi:hypothetical protein